MPSYEQNEKNKKWSVRFRAFEDGIEKNKRLSGFKTKREAAAAYLDYAAQLKENEKKQEAAKAPREMQFKILADGYLQNQKTRVKESSYIATLGRLNKHILPHFGEMKVKDITPLVVLEWQQGLDGYAYRHKRSLRTLLSAIFKHGERYYDLTNIITKVEPLRNTAAPKQINYWSFQEFKSFIDCIEDEKTKLLFKFLYITGCRKGECQAVTWGDIDFNAATVKIDKNITRKTAEGAYKVVAPKNATSNRIVDLPKNFCEELRAWKNGAPNEYIFGGVHPISDKMIERPMKKYSEIAGVKKIRIHDLRHSCASYLISQGVSIVAVSHRLGHKDIEQTLNTYSHLMPKEADMIVKMFENV